MNFTTFFKAVFNVPLNLQPALTRLKKATSRSPMLFKNIIIRVNITALIIAVTLMQASAAVHTHDVSSVEINSTITSNSSLTINGKISDEKGQPLAGVSVKIKGTAKGVATDASGNYTIKADNGDILVFSFIGFVSQEVTISQAANYNIQLKEDPKSLTEGGGTAR